MQTITFFWLKRFVAALIVAISTQTVFAQPFTANADDGVALNNQGFALAQQGQHAKAIVLYQQALPHLTAQDARTQINRASTLNNLGVALTHQKRLSEAQQSFVEAIFLRSQYLGENAERTLLSRHNLGMVWWQQGQNNLACQHMQAVVKGRRHTLGINHVDTQLSNQILAQIPNCERI